MFVKPSISRMNIIVIIYPLFYDDYAVFLNDCTCSKWMINSLLMPLPWVLSLDSLIIVVIPIVIVPFSKKERV